MPTAFDENGRPILIVYDENGNPQRADAKTRSALARRQMEDAVTARAMQTRAGTPDETPSEAQARLESVLRPAEGGRPPQAQPYMGPQTTNLPEAAAQLNALAGLTLGGQALVQAPVAAGKALLGGVVGSTLGKEGGEWLGRRAPVVGGETGAQVGGTVGALVGGGVGAAKLSGMSGRQLLNLASGGRLGALTEGAAAAAPETAAAREAVAAATARRDALALEEQQARIAKIRQATEQAAERHDLNKQILQKRLAGKAPTQAPKPTASTPTEPAPAPSTAATAAEPETAPAAPPTPARAQADEIVAQAQRWRNEHKWSGAQIQSALQNVYHISPKDSRQFVSAMLEAEGTVSPLQAPRIQVGAQKVGRDVGMTKEQVRQAAGPVVGETRGEASPIIPAKAWERIVDDMKALPKTGGFREAYVARASAGKNRGQVEQLRRTLEHLGLLLPLGAVAGVAASSEG